MQFITNYNIDWPEKFHQIRDALSITVPAGCIFHHVGSTSIPGMPAKDIIDLDIECPIGSILQVIDSLKLTGYEHEGDKGVPMREAFRPLPGSKASEFPEHHLYVCDSGSPELLKHKAFRDYLIHHPDRAEWLAQEKMLADRKAATRDEYISLKSSAYEIIIKESMEWINHSTVDF